MKRPSVSVVICARNEELFIRPAVESILAQSLNEHEVIVVDDASDDATGAILGEIADRRLRVIRNAATEGIARSRNKALAAAQAEFLAVMDADDCSEPGRLSTQACFLQAHPRLAAVGTFARMVDADGNTLGVIPTPLDAEAIRSQMRHRAALIHGTVMMRASALRGLGGYREKFVAGADYDLLYRLSELAPMATIPEPLYRYRLSPKSVSAAMRGAQRRGIELVKRFADQRSRSGADDYQVTPPEAFTEPFEARDALSAAARYHIHAAKLAAAAGRMSLARSHARRAFAHHGARLEAGLLGTLTLLGPSIYVSIQRRLGTTRIEHG